MQIPVQVTFRNMDASPALESKIQEKAHKLEQVFNRITSCRVVVEADHRHHHQGFLYHVRIDVTVPEKELVVSRQHDRHPAHEDAFVAVRDAFNAMRKQLEHHAEKLRGDVKTHEEQPQGTIIDLDPIMESGTINTVNGQEVLFHRNSLVDTDYESLKVGDLVSFIPVNDPNGTRATTVHLLHHPAESRHVSGSS